MIMAFSKRKLLTSFLSVLLMLTFILTPLSQTMSLKHLQAQEVVWDPANYIPNYGTWIQTMSGTAASWLQSGLQQSLNLKEFTLDGIAWALANIVIKEMIISTTQWVKSGFRGNPAFVTDLGGFLTDIADRVAGNFIWGTPLALMCAPFRLDVRLALQIQHNQTQRYRAECRISDAVKNFQNFFDGDFIAGGGWNAWHEITLNPVNNPYGQYLEAQSALQATISSAQGNQVRLLDWGRGFLSVRDPNCQPNPDNPDEFDILACKTVTPGSVVESQINTTLGLPAGRLQVADEFNELIGALFAQLTMEVFNGAKGLLGLGQSSQGTASYLDRMYAEQTPFSSNSISGTGFDSAIADETRYMNLEQQVVSLITAADTYKERTYGTTTSCHPGTLSDSLWQQLQTAQSEVVKSSATIAKLAVFRTDYNLLQSPTTSSAIINNLRIKYNASSIPEAETNLLNEYMQYRSSGLIHTQGDSIMIESITLPNLRTEIQTFTSSVDIACERRTRSRDTGD
jgi:hypothetical protein